MWTCEARRREAERRAESGRTIRYLLLAAVAVWAAGAIWGAWALQMEGKDGGDPGDLLAGALVGSIPGFVFTGIMGIILTCHSLRTSRH